MTTDKEWLEEHAIECSSCDRLFDDRELYARIIEDGKSVCPYCVQKENKKENRN